jgi:hypothetical protein
VGQIRDARIERIIKRRLAVVQNELKGISNKKPANSIFPRMESTSELMLLAEEATLQWVLSLHE